MITGSRVTTEDLAMRLDDPALRILDASFYLLAQRRDPDREFAERHIRGAVRFDIDAISDHDDPLPHMMPTPAAFADAMGRLGIGSDADLVIYDTTPMFGACRAWWMFKTFGHASVAVLDGGLPKWVRERRPVARETPPPGDARFLPRHRPALICDLDRVRAALADGAQVVDARSAERFAGKALEPRPGLRAGHMPGATNLPHTSLIDPTTGCMWSPDELRRRFADAGIDPDKPVITTCGSGVTACVIAFALDLVGATHVAVYDGSWAEWGARADVPVAASR